MGSISMSDNYELKKPSNKFTYRSVFKFRAAICFFHLSNWAWFQIKPLLFIY